MTLLACINAGAEDEDDALNDAWRSVESASYEFRKRAAKAEQENRMTDTFPPAPEVNFPPVVATRRAALVREYAHHHEKLELHELGAERCALLIAEIDSTAIAIFEQISEAGGEELLDPPSVSQPKAAATAEAKRRERRDVRGMVLDALRNSINGRTAVTLAGVLEITKRQVETALDYHHKNGEAWCGHDGVWFSGNPQIVGNGTEQPQPLDEPLSLLDVIRDAGEEGITDEDLAKRGFAYVAVIKAEKRGEVRLEGRRVFLNETTPQ